MLRSLKKNNEKKNSLLVIWAFVGYKAAVAYDRWKEHNLCVVYSLKLTGIISCVVFNILFIALSHRHGSQHTLYENNHVVSKNLSISFIFQLLQVHLVDLKGKWYSFTKKFTSKENSRSFLFYKRKCYSDIFWKFPWKCLCITTALSKHIQRRWEHRLSEQKPKNLCSIEPIRVKIGSSTWFVI